MRLKGCVYIIGSEVGLYNIGISRIDPKQKLAIFQLHSPLLLKLVVWFWVRNAPAFKQELHNRFSARRLHGEWFTLSSQDVAAIEDPDEKEWKK